MRRVTPTPASALPMLALLLPSCAQGADLIILVDTATEMPMARFERERLVDGIHRDIGALAGHMQRTPKFMLLPRKRIVRALEQGAADVLCSYVQGWLNGSFEWPQPSIPIVEVLIAERSVERPRQVIDVAGRPIGTVLGYAHPEMEALLGDGSYAPPGKAPSVRSRPNMWRPNHRTYML